MPENSHIFSIQGKRVQLHKTEAKKIMFRVSGYVNPKLVHCFQFFLLGYPEKF